MPKLKKSVSILDLHKYKLTTFKGMTVPRGYADGHMSAYEAYLYLQKLGIPEGFYEDVKKALVYIPKNVIATNPDGEEFTDQFVGAKEDEKTFEEFKARAQGENWGFRPAESPVDENDFAQPSTEVPQSYDDGGEFAAQLIAFFRGKNYTVSDIRAVAEIYSKQLQERRLIARSTIFDKDNLKATLEALDGQETRAAGMLNDLVVGYRIHKDTERATKNKSRLETASAVVKDAKSLIADRNWFVRTQLIDSAAPDIHPEFNTFKFNLRSVTNTGGAVRPAIHLGALLAAAKLAGNNHLFDILTEKIKDLPPKSVVDKLKETGSMNASQVFASSKTPELGFQKMMELLSGVTDPGELLERAYELSFYLRPREDRKDIYTLKEPLKRGRGSTKRRDEEIITERRTLSQISTLTEDAARGVPLAERNEQAESVEKLLTSVKSGNEGIQALISAVEYHWDSLEDKKSTLLTLFGAVDLLYDTRNSFGMSLKDFAKEKLDKLKDDSDFSDLRVSISLKLLGSPLITPIPLKLSTPSRKAGTAQEKLARIMTILENAQERVGDDFDGKMFVVDSGLLDIIRNEGYSSSKTSKIQTETLSLAIQRILKKGNTKLYKKERITSLIDSADLTVALNNLGLKGGDGKEISAVQLRRLSTTMKGSMKKRAEILDKALSSLRTKNGISEVIVRGVRAIFVSAITHQLGLSKGASSGDREARQIIHRVLQDTVDRYDPSVGCLVSKDNAIFAEVFTRARFMPVIEVGNDDDGKIHFGDGLKNFLINEYRQHHDSVNEPTEEELLQFMSHSDSGFSAHYLVENAIKQHSAVVTPESTEQGDGLPVLLGGSERTEFLEAFSSANHHPRHDSTAPDDVKAERERVNAVHNNVVGVIGNSPVADDGFDRYIRGEFTAAESNISIVSLLSVGRNKLMGGKLDKDQYLALGEEVKKLVMGRLSDTGGVTDKAVLDYYEGKIGEAVNKLSNKTRVSDTTGHTLEFLAGMPALIHHFKASGGTGFKEIKTLGLDGVTWTGSDNKTHYFGKMAKATGGSVDMLHLVEGKNGIEIDPMEIKMAESSAPEEIGSVEHVTKFIANLWKKKRKKIKMNGIVGVNTPWGSDARSSGATFYKFKLDNKVKAQGLQTSGRTMSDYERTNLS
jgi:hypothetical protein